MYVLTNELNSKMVRRLASRNLSVIDLIIKTYNQIILISLVSF